MAYVTNEDVQLWLGTQACVQLTDDAGAGVANPAVIEAARAAAEGEVNSHLARRHRVPIDLAAHPELRPVLTSVTLDLVAYRLHARRPPAPADVAERYRAARAWLEAVAAGEAVLPSAAPLTANPATGPAATVVGDPAALGRAEFEGL